MVERWIVSRKRSVAPRTIRPAFLPFLVFQFLYSMPLDLIVSGIELRVIDAINHTVRIKQCLALELLLALRIVGMCLLSGARSPESVACSDVGIDYREIKRCDRASLECWFTLVCWFHVASNHPRWAIGW